MKININYGNYTICVMRTGDITTIRAYSHTIPVETIEANSIKEAKKLINKGAK